LLDFAVAWGGKVPALLCTSNRAFYRGHFTLDSRTQGSQEFCSKIRLVVSIASGWRTATQEVLPCLFCCQHKYRIGPSGMHHFRSSEYFQPFEPPCACRRFPRHVFCLGGVLRLIGNSMPFGSRLIQNCVSCVSLYSPEGIASRG